MKIKYTLKSRRCVSSMWPAKWIVKKNVEACQCPFECKVQIVSVLGKHEFTVNETEFKKLRKSRCIVSV